MLSSSGDLVVATAAGGNGTLTSLNVTANTQIGTSKISVVINYIIPGI